MKRFSLFLFVVRHLRWLARIPGAPQIFDALLLTLTALFYRKRLAAMELLEKEMLERFANGDGIASLKNQITLKTHRFGGLEFVLNGRELGHLHGNGLLDLRLEKACAAELAAGGKMRPHHMLPQAGWISFQLESPADVPFALELLDRKRALCG